LPSPTSSAKTAPLDKGDLKANKAASIWCGFNPPVHPGVMLLTYPHHLQEVAL
jgi:hypothetical protein